VLVLTEITNSLAALLEANVSRAVIPERVARQGPTFVF
jgi:hypothetical protein